MIRKEYILEFLSLSRSCNYHTAALEQGISQPALSKHIKLLEDSLGEPLFTRSTRSVELTPFGQMFLEHAQKYSQVQLEMEQEVLRWRSRNRQILVIGTMPAAVEYGVTECIAEFKKQVSDCYVELMDASMSRVRMMLRYGKCDFAFVPSAKKEDSEFASFVVAEDKHAVLLPKRHPLAGQRKVNVAQLQHESIHCLSTEMPTYELYKEACLKAGIMADLEIAGAGSKLLVGIVEKNHGVSVLTRRQALRCRTPNIVMVDLEAPMQLYVNFLYVSQAERSPLARQFFSFAQEFFS